MPNNNSSLRLLLLSLMLISKSWQTLLLLNGMSFFHAFAWIMPIYFSRHNSSIIPLSLAQAVRFPFSGSITEWTTQLTMTDDFPDWGGVESGHLFIFYSQLVSTKLCQRNFGRVHIWRRKKKSSKCLSLTGQGTIWQFKL